jgi:hypothetical protein
MRKLSVFLAVLALCLANLAMAAGAIATHLMGTASVQSGSAAPRALHVGDPVKQGETVRTGKDTYLLMKFDDGELVVMTQNSTMTVSAYDYDARSGNGNVLLSLVEGGMRAITGLIGRRTPTNVAYRAAGATIGIRGTDVQIHTTMGDVAVLVHDGVITFTIGNQTATISAGQGGRVVNGMPVSASMASIIAALLMQNTPQARAIALDLSTVLPATLTMAITTALQNPTNTQTDTKTDTKKDTDTHTGGGTQSGNTVSNK